MLKKAMSKKTQLWISCVGNRGRADISCSYMVSSSSQIWFLSPPKIFFHLFMFSYSLLVEVYCAFFHCSFCSFQDTSLTAPAFPC